MAAKTTGKTTQAQKKTAAAVLRDRKIEAYREKIQQDQESISTLEADRNALLSTNLVGAVVHHFTFGSGTVAAQDPASITVEFSFGNKKFIMPSAFIDSFLSTTDSKINSVFEQYQALSEQLKTLKESICLANRSISILENK